MNNRVIKSDNRSNIAIFWAQFKNLTISKNLSKFKNIKIAKKLKFLISNTRKIFNLLIQVFI